MTYSSLAVCQDDNDSLKSCSNTKRDLQIELYTGVFIPLGNIAFFGVHPTIGVNLKVETDKNSYGIFWQHRFGKSKNEYIVGIGDSLITASRYDGNYIGFEYSRNIYESTKHKIKLLAGVGGEWFSPQKSSNSSNAKITLTSIALNTGFGYTFFFKKGNGIVSEMRYSFSNFNTNGGVNMSNASAIDIRLSYLF